MNNLKVVDRKRIEYFIYIKSSALFKDSKDCKDNDEVIRIISLLHSRKLIKSVSKKTCYFLLHCNENPIYVFPEKELRGLSSNFHINVSVSDLYVYSQDWSTYCIFLQQNILGRPIVGIYQSLT